MVGVGNEFKSEKPRETRSLPASESEPKEKKERVETAKTKEKTEAKEYGPVKLPLKDNPSLLLKIFLGVAGIVIVSLVMLLAEQVLAMALLWIAVIVYIAACLKDITPEEKGIKITLWTPDEEYMYTGGLYWRWFPFQWFYLSPTEQVIIDIPEQKVITAKETATIDGEKKVYSEAEIGVNAVLYFFWPDNPKGLCEAYRKAPDPHNLEKLNKFFKPSLAATVRRVAGRFSWLRVRMSEQEYMNALHEEVKDNEKGPMVKAGITDFNIENESVELPPALEKLITAMQEATYEKDAGEINAELERIKLAKKGEGDAEARERILAAMAKNPEMAKLLTLQEMAQGPASTIFVEIPKELKGALSGDEIPPDLVNLWNTIPKSQRTGIVTEFLKSLKKK